MYLKVIYKGVEGGYRGVSGGGVREGGKRVESVG